jgi:hypothetical protein
MLKLLTVLVAGLLTFLTVRRLLDHFARRRITVRAQPAPPRRAITRLRQDPESGVYYPEN